MHAARFLWAVMLLLAMAGARAQFVAVPPLSGHVTDQAGMLDAGQRGRLEAQLADYEAKTGSQIAILLVNSTEPEAIEQYSIRVADAWKLGRKGVDDGVLLLVAKNNPSALRRLRIEAGRGVQGVLTDAKSKQILQDVIAPYFRRNQFYEGLSAGVSAIAHLLNQEKFPAPPQPAPQASNQQDEGGLPLPLILFGIIVLFAIFRPRRRSSLAHGGWGSGATGFILGSALGNLGRGGGGGFSGGGSSDGGGFSGGGGSFDGGGASGDW